MTGITLEQLPDLSQTAKPDRVAHAFPDGSMVSVCGVTRHGDTLRSPAARKCPECVRLIGNPATR